MKKVNILLIILFVAAFVLPREKRMEKPLRIASGKDTTGLLVNRLLRENIEFQTVVGEYELQDC